MTRRRLTPEEIDLWRKVVRQAERLHPDRAEPVHPKPLPKPRPRKSPQMRAEPSEIGPTVRRPTPGNSRKPTVIAATAPLQMDRKAFARMTRGKLKPEGRLDLHGMRLNAAHPALIRFILSAQASGKRLVLVITGKGKDRDEPGPIPAPRGVLRNQVPQWLAAPPLAQVVLQVAPAHASHGGDGAMYVYLRRMR